MKESTWKHAVGVVGLSVCLALVWALATRVDDEPERMAGNSSSSRLPIGGEVQWVVDMNDDQRLVGISHNVFVGKVVERLGTKLVSRSIPWTQFVVEIVLNVKGNLKGTIVINQFGGEVEGKPVPIADVVPLLEPGYTYLLTAGFVNGEYHMNGHPNASKLISGDADADLDGLRSIARSSDRVRALQDAYVSEVPYDGYVRSGRSYNAYYNRCLDATGELIDDTVQLSREKEGLPKVDCVTRLAPEDSSAMTPTVTPARTPGPTPIEPELPVVPTVKPPPPLPTL